MAKIKRKISKRRSKTRKNCIPCNPSSRGIRRINPDLENEEDKIDEFWKKVDLRIRLYDTYPEDLVSNVLQIIRKDFYGFDYDSLENQIQDLKSNIDDLYKILK